MQPPHGAPYTTFRNVKSKDVTGFQGLGDMGSALRLGHQIMHLLILSKSSDHKGSNEKLGICVFYTSALDEVATWHQYHQHDSLIHSHTRASKFENLHM